MADSADTPTPSVPDPAAFAGLDRVLHEKARLAILSSLLAHRDGLSFADLRKLCQLTDGNLSRHLQTLQEAGMVDIEKMVIGRRTQTTAVLTVAGKAKFVQYLELLEGIVASALQTAEETKPAGVPPRPIEYRTV